jgi:hypothetical protein
MNNLIYKVLLFAALSLNSPLLSQDADIFIETLTLNTPIEAQELQDNTPVISSECVWQATLKCRAQIRAFRFAPEQDYQTKALEARECLINHPCALSFKKTNHFS